MRSCSGPDAVDRRNGSVQHVIDAVVVARLLDGGDVGRLFDHADEPLIAGRAGTIDAGINVGDVVADRAQAQAGLDVVDGSGEGVGVVFAGAQNMERQPLRRLAANAGKFLELVNQTSHGFSEARHRIG